MYMDAKKDLDYALAFTALYQSESDIYLREAKCLALQLPYVLMPMRACDLIVGYMKHGYVGFSPQYGGSYTYYYWDDRVEDALCALQGTLSEEYLAQVAAMRAFWREENTEHQVAVAFSEKYGRYIQPGAFYYGVCRIAGMNVDLKLLVKEGLPGLKARNAHYRAQNGNDSFYDALDLSIDAIRDACLMYAKNAKQLAEASTGAQKAKFEKIEAVFLHIADHKPVTFHQALQLIWIYAVSSDLMNFGRMDNILYEFYCNDIDNGSMTEEEAIELLSSFYRCIVRVSKVHDSRIIIGGLGRENPEKADRLAFALIETAKRVIDVVPQLTLRYYSGMNPLLMEKTLDNIKAGAVYPIVYSDDVTVPAMQEIYGISKEEAYNWVPLGCGEYILEGIGAATPNTGMTLSQALDVVLHEGYNSFTKRKEADNIPPISAYKTFEDLFSTYSQMLTWAAKEEAYHEQLNYEVAARQAGYLHLSLLVHDSVEKGLSVFGGGCRYLSATSEIFGLITAADSFTAIQKCVYEDRLFTLEQLVAALDANFEGYEEIRRILLAAPKYGNDDDYADAMACRVFDHVAQLHMKAGEEVNLYNYNIVSVNNSGSAERGLYASATACGRMRGEPLSNGNSPSLGADKQGLTATLNSMRKIDASKHVGVVHNIRFNKDLLCSHSDKIRMLLEAFYEGGGVQTNLSAVGKDDLEQAMLHPEKYQNLIVRIGGFSARFVELDPIVQHELLLRTTVGEV